MIIKGEAGSGKTTFINHLVWSRHPIGSNKNEQSAQSLLPKSWQSLPVIHIRLRNRDIHWLADDSESTLLNALETITPVKPRDEDKQQATINAIRDVMQDPKKGAILLFDGLDELAKEQHTAFWSVVQQLEEDEYLLGREGRLLITGRPHAFASEVNLQNYMLAKLKPLTPEQQKTFIHNWMETLGELEGWDKNKQKQQAKQLTQSLQAHKHLKEMAGRPLWLTLMAILQTHYNKPLPNTVAGLFDQLLDLMLQRWQSWDILQTERISESSMQRYQQTEQYRQTLSSLAFQLHQAAQEGDENKQAYWSKTQILQFLAPQLTQQHPEQWLNYLLEGAAVLEQRSEDQIGFVITSLQEYLAGYYLAQQTDFPIQARQLLGENFAHWYDGIFYALASLKVKDPRFGSLVAVQWLVPNEVPETYSDKDAFAAIVCGRYLHSLSHEVDSFYQQQIIPLKQRLQYWLLNIVETGRLDAKIRAEAGDVLGQLGDPRFYGAEFAGLPRFAGNNKAKLGFEKIPAGEFWMGADKTKNRKANDNECVNGKAHKVNLDYDFWINRYPVTVAQYACFVEEGGAAPNLWEQQRHHPSRAVTRMDWHQAKAYCKWLTEKLQNWQDTQGMIARLPTEAEWEKAARGGDQRIYAWGDAWDSDKLNTDESGVAHVSAVGLYEWQHPYGLFDMSGNVFEWTSTNCFEDEKKNYYPYLPEKETERMSEKYAFVLRGGSWSDYDWGARCSSRLRELPRSGNNDVGFRVLLSLASDS